MENVSNAMLTTALLVHRIISVINVNKDIIMILMVNVLNALRDVPNVIRDSMMMLVLHVLSVSNIFKQIMENAKTFVEIYS